MMRFLFNKVQRHQSTCFKLLVCNILMTLLVFIVMNTDHQLDSTSSNLIENKQHKEFSTCTESSKKKVHKLGHVDSHLWYKVCSISMDSMRQHPLFPLWPVAHGQPEMRGELESITILLWSFQRVLGYLHPPISGYYTFRIFSDTLTEFWLSSDSNPRNASLIARNNRNPLLNIIHNSGPLKITSEPVFLCQGDVYFFDLLHSVNNVRRKGKVMVRWRLPGNQVYTGIPKKSLSTFLDTTNFADKNVVKLLTSSASLHSREYDALKQPRPYEWTDKIFTGRFPSYSDYTKENFHTVEFADRSKIMSVFDKCDYAPSYTRKRHYQRFSGVEFTHFSQVFPDDGTFDKLWHGYLTEGDSSGNTVIEENEVVYIVNMFMTQVNAQLPNMYALANVINVERNVDQKQGKRYLLELLLLELKTNNIQRVSEYLYRFNNKSDVLCRPRGLSWNPSVKINAVLTAKNQGPWVVHYIKNMAAIVHATGDRNVHFILVDYGNNGVDIDAEFRRNNISEFTVIKMKGKFHKTLAIHEAAKVIKDPNSIIFLNDLHLVAPNSIFNSVRKHTIKRKMTFTPVLFRLTKCSGPDTEDQTSHGHWETFGYGVFSAYKSDWTLFGGVNVTEFKHKWGGEDSEMVDRVLAKGIEIERLRLPGFYHYHHDRSGMWEDAG